MRKLFSDKRTCSALILNIAGAVMVIATGLLYEISNFYANGLLSAGVILWLIGEGILIRTLISPK